MILTDQDLTSENTLGLPCIATAVADIVTNDDLFHAKHYAEQHGLPLRVLGGGSNVLLPTRLKAMVLRPKNRGVVVEENDESFCVTVNAAEPWHAFVVQMVAQGIDGLENLALIPGLAGASVIQNIGAYGVEISQFVERVNAFDLSAMTPVSLTCVECEFAYRDSLFKRDLGRYYIVSVTLRLPKRWQAHIDYPALKAQLAPEGSDITAQQILNAVISVRTSKLPDPCMTPNAGSFFKNPVVDHTLYQRLRQLYPSMPAYPQTDGRIKLAAGWLIDQCGWRGKSLGHVAMYDKQALVLINCGGADYHDVEALKKAVMASCLQRFGVHLEQEPIPF